MNRFFGACMIGVVCAWVGFKAADRLSRRKEFLRAFITTLTVIETEIEFGKYELKYIFKKFQDNRKLFGFYERCVDGISEKGIKKAWQAALNDTKDKAPLKSHDVEAILSLGNELGMSDIGGQKKSIKRCIKLLSESEKEANEEYIRLAKVYRGCGVLAGVFVIIMVV